MAISPTGWCEPLNFAVAEAGLTRSDESPPRLSISCSVSASARYGDADGEVSASGSTATRIGAPVGAAVGRDTRSQATRPTTTSNVAAIEAIVDRRHRDDVPGVEISGLRDARRRTIPQAGRQIAQRRLERAGALITSRRIGVQRAIDHGDERSGQVRTHVTEPAQLAALMRRAQLLHRRGRGRELPGDEIEEEHAEAVDVRAGRRRLPGKNLGREIERGADQARRAARRRALLAGAEVHQHDAAAAIRAGRSAP